MISAGHRRFGASASKRRSTRSGAVGPEYLGASCTARSAGSRPQRASLAPPACGRPPHRLRPVQRGASSVSVARHNAQGCNSKSRVVISKKYQGKDLYLAFPADGRWYPRAARRANRYRGGDEASGRNRPALHEPRACYAEPRHVRHTCRHRGDQFRRRSCSSFALPARADPRRLRRADGHDGAGRLGSARARMKFGG